MTTKCILFLCEKSELNRERYGYFKAFSKHLEVICISPNNKLDNNAINQIVSNFDPILIIHPDPPSSLFPKGLVEQKIPTACFQIDTFSGTKKRIKWSMLFDYVFVFHPKFDWTFQKSGHPRSVCLTHAVEADLFDGLELSRIYEVGWVGNLQGREYDKRRRIIEKLKTNFCMNDVSHFYNSEEMATVYKQSKIVVNISRDDYPQDANLRCFEVMASGALLITQKPTELDQIGFIEGTHYIAYNKESQIPSLVKFYLEHEKERIKISNNGRLLVLSKHTYDHRVKTILDILSQDNGQLFSPARNWNKIQESQIYLHYFAKRLMLDSALKELREIRNISRFRALLNLPLIIKSFIRSLQLSL